MEIHAAMSSCPDTACNNSVGCTLNIGFSITEHYLHITNYLNSLSLESIRNLIEQNREYIA